jgi:hypothetical protein
MMYRRREPRRPAGWGAVCLIEDELSTTGWRECTVLDFSSLGLAIVVRHGRPSELVGRSIAVEMPSASDSVSVRLEGEIRNITTISPEIVRLGIEFTGLSPVEQAITTVLSSLT